MSDQAKGSFASRAGRARRVGLRPLPRPMGGPAGLSEKNGSVPTFAEYAAGDWWRRSRGFSAITRSPRTRRRHHHTRMGYGAYRVDDRRCAVPRLKAHLLEQAREIREAIEGGVDLRERRGHRRRPLGPSTIRKVLGALRAILEDAVEDGLLERNPARGRRMRVAVVCSTN